MVEVTSDLGWCDGEQVGNARAEGATTRDSSSLCVRELFTFVF